MGEHGNHKETGEGTERADHRDEKRISRGEEKEAAGARKERKSVLERLRQYQLLIAFAAKQKQAAEEKE